METHGQPMFFYIEGLMLWHQYLFLLPFAWMNSWCFSTSINWSSIPWPCEMRVVGGYFWLLDLLWFFWRFEFIEDWHEHPLCTYVQMHISIALLHINTVGFQSHIKLRLFWWLNGFFHLWLARRVYFRRLLVHEYYDQNWNFRFLNL